jgi:monovalent cation/hydrogen antiporter
VANDAQTLLTASQAGTGGAGLGAGRLEQLLPDWTTLAPGNAYVVRPSGRFTPDKTRFINATHALDRRAARGTPLPMAVFELVLLLLLGGVCLMLLAPRLGIPWPALLAAAGVVLAFVPGMPEVQLDPDLALALFVAPVLLDAAYDASPRDLRRNWLPVGGLVLGAVVVTVAAVAVTARVLEPGLPWAAAAALGAIVAPPDAAAAASIMRQVRLPHRIAVIIEGESLLNDASALMIYRLAVIGAAGGVTVWAGGLLLLGGVGSAILGVLLAKAYLAF